MGNYWRPGEHWGDAEYEDATPNEAEMRRLIADEAERRLLYNAHLAREIGTFVMCVLPFVVVLLLLWWRW